jgi:signal peptidase I
MGKIKSAEIKPGDIIKFEYGDYGNWVTVRIDEVHIDSPTPHTYYPQKLIWHYLSDEAQSQGAPKDCRAEKLGNNPQTNQCPYPQFTCYSNPNDIVEKLN